MLPLPKLGHGVGLATITALRWGLSAHRSLSSVRRRFDDLLVLIVASSFRPQRQTAALPTSLGHSSPAKNLPITS